VLLDASKGRIRCRCCGGAEVYLSGEARHFMAGATEPMFLDVDPPSERARLESRGAIQKLAAQHLSLELPLDPMR
jgi:hypothetical protein